MSTTQRAQIMLDPKDYTVAWIAPLEIEAKAAMCLLDEEHPGRFPVSRGDDHVYLAGAMGGHNIVIATLPAGQEYGTGSAAALAGQIKKFFPNLWFGLLVGVAAGLPDLPARDIRLGDVLVGLPVGEGAGLVPYDLGKETEDGFQLLRLGHSQAMTEPIVRSAIGSIKLRAPNDTKLFLPYYKKIHNSEHTTGTFADPGQDNDILFNDDGDEEVVEHPQRSKSNYERAQVWYGPIGSGDKLLKNAKKRNELRDKHGIIGLEMEAAGIMNRIPVGVIRGVCDYGDRHKNKDWQPYAAAMAASYARALLDEIPLSPRNVYIVQKAQEACYHIPLARNTRFTGRTTILNALEDKFFGPDQCHRVALVGLGGIGKTQIALSFAYQMKEHRPDYSIFWVPVLSDETAERAYADIAKKLRLQKSSEDEDEDVKDLVCQYLSSDEAGKWLFIVDNADEEELIVGSGEKPGLEEYLPQSENGIILLTTRSGHVAGDFAQYDVIDIDQMDVEEAKILLEKSLIRKQLLQDEVAVAELLTYLAFLPLAITQAASYLNQTKAPIQTYLGLLRNAEDKGMKVLEREFRDNTRYRGSQNAVGTTWIVSIRQIQKSNQLAIDLLSFMACIEPKVIPKSMLPAAKPDELEWALGTLCSYSFLVRREENDVFDMHSLVHTAIRGWLEKQGQESRVSDDAIRHLAARFPAYYDVHYDALRKEYLPHAMQVLSQIHEDKPVEIYQLYTKAGHSFLTDRRFKEAIKCYEKEYWWRQSFNSETDSDRLTSEYNLASAYLQDRRIKDAVEMLEHVVAVEKEIYDEKNHDRLASEHVLASAYLQDQQIKKAVEKLEHVVAVQKEIHDDEDYDRLTSEHELARAYLRDWRTKDAIDILEHVVAIRKMLEEKDPSRLASEHELARAYLRDGRTKDAVEILEHVVANKEMLDEKDWSRLESEHELARAYLGDGRTKDAIAILEHVVAIRKMLEEKDPSRLSSENNLGRTYLADGRTKEAIEILEHVVAVKKETLDEKDPSRLLSQYILANAYLADGRTKEGIEILEHVVAVEKETLDEQDHSR
ncbi:hypothetical protein ACHAPY_009187 [Fusarium culmorum]